MPVSMELWRKPAVLENTSTRGCCACLAKGRPAVVSTSNDTTMRPRSIEESLAMIRMGWCGERGALLRRSDAGDVHSGVAFNRCDVSQVVHNHDEVMD